MSKGESEIRKEVAGKEKQTKTPGSSSVAASAAQSSGWLHPQANREGKQPVGKD